MKKVLIVLAGAGAVGAAGLGLAHEGHKHAGGKAPVMAVKPAQRRPVAAMEVAKVRLTGELVDPQCWFTHYGEGQDHAKCAVSCARGGQDLAFLDETTGQLFPLIATSHGKNPNAGLYDHVGVRVSVQGMAYQRGSNRALLLERVEKAR